MVSNFTFLDSLILFAYLIITLSLGFYYSSKKDKNFDDYFLAGRNMGWITVGLSIFATNISSEHFIGLAGAGASRGLAAGHFELMAIFVLILLGWVLSPIYIKSGVKTVPEFLEKRFDRSTRKFFAAFSIAMYILTKITVTLFAGGILFYKIFGLNLYTSTIIIVLITGIYSVIGGATAVMKTHVFQALILIGGAVTLTVFGLHEVGGFAGLKQKLPPEFFNMFKPASDPNFPWVGIIFGAPIIAFWYWCTDQYFVQKILSAKSIDDARRGSLLAAFLKILPIFILVLPGLIAAAIYPEINGDEAYPVLLASSLLPVGIKGFVVAGILAAIMSSLSSVFNTTAMLFTNDFYKPKHPDSTERELVLIGRLSTTAIVVMTILCVPLVKLISNQVYLFLQGVQSFISPPITALFIVGLLMKKANAKGAIWTLIIGEGIGFLRLFLEMAVNANMVSNPLLLSIVHINFLYFAIFLFIFSVSLMIVISLNTQENKEPKIVKVQYLFPDTIHEISFGIKNINTVSGYKTNLLMSGFILLIIIGLWSIWY
ncbi:MAG: sodium:solute symporter [Ignavibacteriaceae bacterium]